MPNKGIRRENLLAEGFGEEKDDLRSASSFLRSSISGDAAVGVLVTRKRGVFSSDVAGRSSSRGSGGTEPSGRGTFAARSAVLSTSLRETSVEIEKTGCVGVAACSISDLTEVVSSFAAVERDKEPNQDVRDCNGFEVDATAAGDTIGKGTVVVCNSASPSGGSSAGMVSIDMLQDVILQSKLKTHHSLARFGPLP